MDFADSKFLKVINISIKQQLFLERDFVQEIFLFLSVIYSWWMCTFTLWYTQAIYDVAGPKQRYSKCSDLRKPTFAKNCWSPANDVCISPWCGKDRQLVTSNVWFISYRLFSLWFTSDSLCDCMLNVVRQRIWLNESRPLTSNLWQVKSVQRLFCLPNIRLGHVARRCVNSYFNAFTWTSGIRPWQT